MVNLRFVCCSGREFALGWSWVLSPCSNASLWRQVRCGEFWWRAAIDNRPVINDSRDWSIHGRYGQDSEGLAPRWSTCVSLLALHPHRTNRCDFVHCIWKPGAACRWECDPSSRTVASGRGRSKEQTAHQVLMVCNSSCLRQDRIVLKEEES